MSRGPEFRIGVLVNVGHATLGGGGAFRIADSATDLGTIDAGVSEEVSARGRQVVIGHSGGMQGDVLIVEATDSAAPLRLNGHDYRGTLELRRGDSGVVVINRLPLEDYVAAVVGAELGKRAPGDEEALKAQAIASRTYAVRNQGRWKDHGYDLAASVSDQVYTGTSNENAMATAATAATRGEVITFNGEPIDAFFFSTCAGRTEDGSAAFTGAARSYLRSVDDLDPSGTPWCASSPRFRWNASWSGTEMAATLRRTLGPEHLPTARAADLRDIRVVSHTASGRAATLELIGRNGRTLVSGQAIRRVLSPLDGGTLRSTDFTVRVAREGGRIERIDIDGRGYGHAVGMCQWGAIGRSRAGQDYRTILSSYFPGTDIQRIY